jgi:putative transposase
VARPPRAKSFPYLGFCRYLVTVGTHHRRRWFSDPQRASALTAQIPPFFSPIGFDVVAYCVMPDHVHLLLEGTSANADLRDALSRRKQRTAYRWQSMNGAPLWQPGFHDRILRDADDTRAVLAYVVQNPVRAGLVQDARDYPWTGSSKYAIGELAAYAGQWQRPW